MSENHPVSDAVLCAELRRGALRIEDLGECAKALLAEVDRLRDALTESLKLQSHYADLLNAHDGGACRAFPDIDSWLGRLEELKRIRE